MLQTVKLITGLASVALLSAIVLFPQLAEARIRCHRGFGWHHGHCYRIHHHHHR